MSCINVKCNDCKEKTKHVVDFWDGENDSHGCLYDCNNKSCDIKIIKDSSQEEKIKNRTCTRNKWKKWCVYREVKGRKSSKWNNHFKNC